jgi:hypothetical protein
MTGASGAEMKSLKKKTRETARIEELLKVLFPDFPPGYPPQAYRYNPACIRLRIVSPRFRAKDRVERHDMVTAMLESRLPKATWWDVSMLVLLSPEDIEESWSNLEFENPTPPPDFRTKLARKASRNGKKNGRKSVVTRRK